MSFRQFVLPALVAAGTLGAAVMPTLSAASHPVVYTRVAPPPLKHTYLPAPRVGHVWVPGFWDYRGYQYFWVDGYWQPHRVGYVYRPHRWVYDHNGWVLNRAHWDRDGDGVPNRFDRYPDNPYRR